MTEPVLRETAYAKINLALHVRRRRDDGYHDIESLFAFAEDGDILTATAAPYRTLTIEGPFAEGLSNGPDNLILRAAHMFEAQTGRSGRAAFALEKHLPVASGIGGGSADAAAAVRLLARFENVEIGPQDIQTYAQIGADVPACILSQPVFGSGVGDVMTPFENPFAGAPLLLVNPRLPLSTATVFRAWHGNDLGPILIGQPADWRNDLQETAITIMPQIGQILDQLARRPGARLTRMSGSGATCFAIFGTMAECDAAAKAFPGCWTLATRIRP